MITITELFTQQVLRTPDVIAVRHFQQTLTYAELNERANRLARYLQSHGVGKDIRVGICLERSIELIISILGVLKAGGAYVPLDPTYPADRLNFMLADSDAVALITNIDQQPKLARFTGHLICLEVEGVEISQLNPENPTNLISVEDLAYVIYTSGSTGQPKGVMVEHRGWTNYIQAAQETYQLKPGERVLQFASISWDTSAEEIFPCLTSGATLVLRTDEMLNSIPKFLQYCTELNVTVINLPTAFWHELVTQITTSELSLPNSMRVVIIGGERALWENLVKWHKYAPANIHLFNTYGQTECTAVTTCVELTQGLTDGFVPLGRPVKNVGVFILDEQLLPVPNGQSGELYISGPGLARGYLHQPELTSQKFINPPSGMPSGRLYKTGDIVRELSDGNLEFVGRIDQQIKIRGIRIEPGEIENLLAQHPDVRLAAVCGQPAGPNPEYLAAYVVLNDQATIKPSELRNWLRKSLPSFFVPAVVMPLKALPMTPNGKIDRRALPVPDFSSQILDAHDDEETLTPTQIELKHIWQEVLGLESVGLNDDFFEIGGHSLLATRVIAHVRQRFNIDISLRTIFDAPTIARLSEQIHTSAPKSNELEISRRNPDDPLITSFSQESLWFLDQLVPGNPTYNISDMLILNGQLDVATLEKAINVLVQRQEILRTHFISIDGQPAPVITKTLLIPLTLIKALDLPENEQLIQINKFAADEVVQPFNLQSGPLLRTQLVQVSPIKHVLIVVIHHIISDGWSIAVFFQELSAIYTQLQTNETTQVLPVLPVQFADYAIWQRRIMQGEQLETQLIYWKEKLHNLTPLNFPLDRIRPVQRSFRGKRLPIKFSPEFSKNMQIFSLCEEKTLFMVLLAGMMSTLARYTNQTDISIGTAIANRHIPELDNIIGFFVNTLVLRTDLEGNPTFHEVLNRIKETTLDAYTHQTVPFELVVQSLHPRRTVNRNPFFDVMLFLQNVNPAKLQISGIQAEFMEIEQRTSEFDFVFDLTETPDGLQGFCEYDTDLFEDASMARFITHFQNFLFQAINKPDEHIEIFSLLSESERNQLLVEWNQTSHLHIGPETLSSLFEAQVRQTPDQVAVICKAESLSYSVLNERANQLAAHLIALGVKKETIIGVCLDRSLELLVTIFGVLKAGAVYLPLDPAYPSERLKFMLSDSQAPWLVTDASLNKIFSDFPGQIINLGEIPPTPDPLGNPLCEINGNNACYMIYTSGSTGRPKGVIGLHNATINRLTWMWEAYPFEYGEICCQKTSLSFVDSIWEIFGPLLKGIPLIIIPEAESKDTRLFVNELAKNHVSRLVLVPSLLRLMLETYTNLDQLLPTLHFWVSSGEALSIDLAEEFLKRMPGRTLLNLYGSSEVAADSTYYEVKKSDKRIGIGRPICNTETYILDDHMQPVPIGVTGEIYIGGAGLARGYWKNPEMTRERFLPHPFDTTPNTRVYKTGDLGRYWPDGNIEYLGRADFQVKIRGYRVELGEIQNVIAEYPGVKQTLVITSSSVESQRIIAYIVLHPFTTVTQAELHRFVKERLPDYMLPGAWVFLNEFPLTPSGKINQLVLPAPDQDLLEHKLTYHAPNDELELRLVKLWEHLLEISPIGIDDNFFEIGGHSMLVVRLITQLERELGKPLSLALIFHAPTISLMASVLRKDGWRPTWSSLVPIRTTGTLPPLFCVHADGGAFFYTRFSSFLSPQQPFYGLQARGLDGIDPPFTNVKDMASHYISEIRTIQHKGPYLISGFSMGGVVIYEMAQQLLVAGEQSLIIFLDAPSPDYPEIIGTTSLEKIKRLFSMELSPMINRLLHRLDQRRRWLTDELLCKFFLFFDRPLSPSLRIHRIRNLNHQISDEYQPKPLNGQAVILRASQQPAGAKPDPTLGWSQYIQGRISEYIIPGDHESIFVEPHVRELANKLQTSIDDWLISN